MAFKLDHVVPWGRNIEEYRIMFQLDKEDMTKKIAGFGDGPASFNCQGTKQGGNIISFDPIYQFTKEELENRIEAVRITVMEQVRENVHSYVWKNINTVEELEHLRMSAMRMFLEDYDQGKEEGRYVCHELPNKLDYEKDSFDIGLSSHFLLLYTALGYDFHIQAILEMLRICKEVRIFPIVDLDANKVDFLQDVLEFFREGYGVEIRETDYEFQKDANKLLVIKHI